MSGGARFAVLVSDHASRDLVLQALDTVSSDTTACTSAAGLQTLLRAQVVDVALIECATPVGVSRAPLLHALADRHPEVMFVALLRQSDHERRHLVSVAKAGVREVIQLGIDPIETVIVGLPLAGDIERATTSVLRILGPRVPASARHILRIAIEAAPSAMTVMQFVIATGAGKSTLSRQITAAGMGTPARVLEWTRVLVAAHLLSTTGRTVRSVSEQLRFPSPKAMAKHFSHLLRARPSDFARGRDPEDACTAFLNDCRAPDHPALHAGSG